MEEGHPNLTSDLPPPRISEIVLRTERYELMKQWYQWVLGAAGPSYEFRAPGRPDATSPLNDFTQLCFFRIFAQHPFTEVVALFEVPGLAERAKSTGLHHLQLRQVSLEVLFTRFERLKLVGVEPFEAHNHGPATSFYYRDVDQNVVELSAMNGATAEDYVAYFSSEAFARNPAGVQIDPSHFVARFRAGEPLSSLVRILPS